MTGQLIGVVGPSGVGKDSVMRALAEARPGFGLVRRVITRPGDAGGEVFDSVGEAEFVRRRAAGDFVLHWQAHGLYYGIPVRVRHDLAQGRTCLVNLSRSVLARAEAQFSDFVTLHLTAPTAVLAQRLAARGRESAAAIEARLSRADYALPAGLGRVVHVANDGPLDQTVTRVLAALQPERA